MCQLNTTKRSESFMIAQNSDSSSIQQMDLGKDRMLSRNTSTYEIAAFAFSITRNSLFIVKSLGALCPIDYANIIHCSYGSKEAIQSVKELKEVRGSRSQY